MTQFYVETRGGDVIVEGRSLSELIEVVMLRKINEIDRKYSSLTKIERNYYQYMNQLGSIFNIAESYEAAIKESPDCLEIVEEAYNQSEFIKETEYIKFKINKLDDLDF